MSKKCPRCGSEDLLIEKTVPDMLPEREFARCRSCKLIFFTDEKIVFEKR